MPAPDAGGWLDSIRRRTHDLANRSMVHAEEIVRLREQVASLKRRVEGMERTCELVGSLQHQATVLRWLLGAATAAGVAALARL